MNLPTRELVELKELHLLVFQKAFLAKISTPNTAAKVSNIAFKLFLAKSIVPQQIPKGV